jgi:hypothetical protein
MAFIFMLKYFCFLDYMKTKFDLDEALTRKAIASKCNDEDKMAQRKLKAAIAQVASVNDWDGWLLLAYGLAPALRVCLTCYACCDYYEGKQYSVAPVLRAWFHKVWTVNYYEGWWCKYTVSFVPVLHVDCVRSLMCLCFSEELLRVHSESCMNAVL